MSAVVVTFSENNNCIVSYQDNRKIDSLNAPFSINEIRQRQALVITQTVTPSISSIFSSVMLK